MSRLAWLCRTITLLRRLGLATENGQVSATACWPFAWGVDACGTTIVQAIHQWCERSLIDDSWSMRPESALYALSLGLTPTAGVMYRVRISASVSCALAGSLTGLILRPPPTAVMRHARRARWTVPAPLLAEQARIVEELRRIISFTEALRRRLDRKTSVEFC